MPDPAPLLDIFRYEDFRAFLRDFYAFEKLRSPRFSYGVFGRRAGVPRNHLKMVVDGTKGLTPRFLEGYLRALRLSGPAAEYFRRLVEASQARSASARQAAEEALRRLRFGVDRKRIAPAEFSDIARDWIRILVLGLARIEGFRAEASWISRSLAGRVTPGEAREALAYLKSKGYLRARGLRVELDEKALFRSESTEPEPDGGVPRHHAQLLRYVAEAPECRRGHRTLIAGQAVLTQREAEALGERLVDWFRASFPAGRKRVRGNLYVAVGDLVPITDLPEGQSSRQKRLR